MTSSTIIGFVNNAALLMALALIYDAFAIDKSKEESALGSLPLGVILGFIGVGIMMNPWEFSPGVIFDTRSVLLCVTSFFFGTVPTIVTILITSGYRLLIGGTGTWTGVGVIVTSAGAGLAWRYWRKQNLENISGGNLYVLGMITHVLMLLWMLTLPASISLKVLSKISIPVLLIFPFGTVLLGKLMLHRFHRVRLDSVLRASEEKYRNLIGNLQEGIWVIDKDNLTTFVNLSMANILGYEVEEMIGRDLFSFMDPQGIETAKQNLERRKNGIKEQHEFEFLKKNGTKVNVFIATRPTRDVNGKYSGATAGVIDITAHKKAEEKLRENEIKYRFLYETMTQGVVIQDADGKIVEANRAACDILGLSMDQMLGKTAYDPRWKLIHEDGSPYDPAEMPSNVVLQTGKPSTGVHCGIYLPEKDEYRWIVIGSVPRIKDGETKPHAAMTVFSDITELHSTEGKLAETEGRYRSLFENMNAGFALFEVVQDAAGVPVDLVILAANRGFENTTGLKAQDVTGKRLTQVLPGIENDAAGWIGTYGKIALTGEPLQFDHYSELLGTYYSIIAYQAGQKQCAITFLDRTEWKQAENALRDNQALLSTLIQTLPDLVWLKNPLGVFLACNPRFESFFGAKQEDIIGKTDYDFLDAELVEFFRKHDNLAIATGKPSTNEEEVVFLDDGHRETLETIKTPMYASDGELIGVLGIGRDITERKKADAALRESEERFRRALENIPDIVVIYDKDLRIKYINEATTRLTGRPSADYIGKSEYEIWPQEIYGKFLPTLQASLETGRTQSIEVELPLTDNGLSYLKITCVPLMDQDGKVREILGITHDLTEHKKAEAERISYEAKLRQAQKLESIGNLAGGIAHDFNNILSSIIGYTELALEEVEKGSEAEDDLQEVYTAGKRAKDLVRQILAFARQSEENLGPLQIQVVVKEVLKFIRSSIPATIEIKSDIDSDSLIWGNHTQVHQIMMNLCTNAAHAMEDEGGILTVGLKDVVVEGDLRKRLALPYGDYIELVISDTGGGIAPGTIDSIFEPYFTTKGPGEGTGMGLAVVHGIVESYSGKIIVESALGQGSAFTIYLPITRKRKSRRIYEPEELPKGTERILFVDDEESIAKMGSRNLEGLGYIVTTRTSSIEALELFQSKSTEFDLVITDMTMPNMAGDRLAVELMKIRPDIPVILCTGYSKKISDEAASDIGIKAFAYKPMVKADLANSVRKVLDENKGLSGR